MTSASTPGVLVGCLLEKLGEFLWFFSGPKALRQMDRRDALQHEVGAWLSVGDVVDHVRCAIPEYLIHPFDSEIPGLIDV